ncbi:SDR family NAD(P)-dependent oxidoreductase [Microtetraspora sp. NBRC 13810]|uniref:SDR family NAD(P)-dependent oxidoreductase n=1 Tax=Microtetraspora sp. NBRC 13810 TaxID=3030990 RepID=UPI0025540CD8|nr:SDR family NAD(P)-dependent oxidoreductase [Microtetraspora sp. NBRC 13810]
MEKIEVAGRTALVTGANRGIGRAVCARLHELGCRVVVAARDEAEAREVAAELGGDALGVALDVTGQESVDRVRERIGHADIVVNNAGVLQDRDEKASTMAPDLVDRHVAVNVTGALRVAQAFLPGMVERGWGRVVMVSSGAGAFSTGLLPWAPAYSVSKAALNAVTLLLAGETRDAGVLVNAVSPGAVRTRMLPTGTRTPEEAAVDVAALATLPDDGPTGTFFRQGKPAPW